jgi:hypothetical protein
MSDPAMLTSPSVYDEDNDAVMMPPHSQRSAEGDSVQARELALDWSFSQVFGERSPGEEVLEGMFFVFVCITDLMLV